jgi:hypothetical protein
MYMQEFDYKTSVSIPQLVALQCILTQYDVEGIQQISSKSKNGSVRVIPLILVKSTQSSLNLKTNDTIYDKHIDKYVNSVQYPIEFDSLQNDQFINKLAVVNGVVVDDVAATPVSTRKS